MMLSRRRWIGGLAASAAAPFVVRNAAAAGGTKLVYQTSWTPEPDEAGIYQAVASGIYAAHGLDVVVNAGGPQLNSLQIFFAGGADFVTTDGFRVAAGITRDLPGIAIAAFYQKPPHVILSHPHAGNDTLEDLRGKHILISPPDRDSFWRWLKAKYGYRDDQALPYTFNMAPFLVDPQLSMQGYITAEPYLAQRAGISPIVHVLADHGYVDYYQVILASPGMVADRPDVVQRFVDATVKGWQSYLFGNPKPANDAIKASNPRMTDEAIAYARAAMKAHHLLDSGDAESGGLGAMSDATWNLLNRTMAQAGALPGGIDIRKGYTLAFIGKHARA